MMNANGTTKFPGRCLKVFLFSQDPGQLVSDFGGHCVLLPRLQLSPSRILFLGFEVEMSNRVIRRFTEQEGFRPEAFLRVRLGDENCMHLFEQDITPPVESSLGRPLTNGVEIFGRRYQFLAYSSSQLKEVSVWMVCPERGWTVESMRASLGDFSSCKTASKYAARIGQCFSTTVEGTPGMGSNTSRSLSHIRHDVVDDIYGDLEQSYCHSDGVGLIKKEAMSRLLQLVPFAPKHHEDVSVVQIRFGGAKGTLKSWDFQSLQSHRNRVSYDVLLRPSMIKFEAPYSHIEVCSVGKQLPYFLNRSVILLLSHHGISDATLLGMQTKMLDDLDCMLQDRGRALEMIRKLSGPDSGIRAVVTQMLEIGLEPSREPFLYDCLVALRSHFLFGLRKKARIFVGKGAVLVGSLDETGLLPEYSIYCEVSIQGQYTPLVGPVLVTSMYTKFLLTSHCSHVLIVSQSTQLLIQVISECCLRLMFPSCTVTAIAFYLVDEVQDQKQIKCQAVTLMVTSLPSLGTVESLQACGTNVFVIPVVGFLRKTEGSI